jgi:hypothetical protein
VFLIISFSYTKGHYYTTGKPGRIPQKKQKVRVLRKKAPGYFSPETQFEIEIEITFEIEPFSSKQAPGYFSPEIERR